MLRNGIELEDCVAEVQPSNGTLLIFRRSDNAWHGHKPYVGPRRAIQFNWVTDEAVVKKVQARHRFSTRVKRWKRLFFGSSLEACGETAAQDDRRTLTSLVEKVLEEYMRADGYIDAPKREPASRPK